LKTKLTNANPEVKKPNIRLISPHQRAGCFQWKTSF